MTARFFAWVWPVVYVGVPPSLLVLLALQRRLPIAGRKTNQ